MAQGFETLNYLKLPFCRRKLGGGALLPGAHMYICGEVSKKKNLFS